MCLRQTCLLRMICDMGTVASRMPFCVDQNSTGLYILLVKPMLWTWFSSWCGHDILSFIFFFFSFLEVCRCETFLIYLPHLL